MQGIQIVATGRALPSKCVSNEDLAKMVDTTDEWIRTRTGIESRYLCEKESCMDLAVIAAKKAIESAGISLDEIGVIIVATTTADYAFPSVACMVQKELGLSKDVMSFDISAACSGFLYGLGVCRGLLLDHRKKYGLVIGSEKMSRITDFSDRSTCVLFGDGSGAAVITLSQDEFIYKAWSDGDASSLFCLGIGNEKTYLHMEGNKVFRFAVKALEEGIEEILKQSNLSIDDIDYVVCHQANKRIIEHVKKKYEGKKPNFYTNMECYANTSAASIPIALDELYEKKLVKKGMKIICVGFGAGFTWSSILLTV